MNFETVLNVTLITATLLGYYIIYLLRVGNTIQDTTAASLFCGLNVAISIAVLCLVLFYAVVYAGNPPTSEKYQLIISETRKLLILFTITRMVRFRIKSRFAV